MKNRIVKSLLAIVLMWTALPMMAQDYIEVYFNNGTHRKFLLRNIEDITVSKNDAAGVSHSDYLFQHIVTKDGNYIYNINDIDSITFKKYHEEIVEHNVASSLSSIFPALDNCQTTNDIEEKIEVIKKSEGVEDAWINGNELCVKIKDWGIMGFLINNEEVEEDDDTSEARFLAQLPSLFSALKNAVNTNTSLKVAIANHTKHDERSAYTKIEKRFKIIESLFKSLGVTPDIVEPSMDFFRSTMFEKDIVILCTHGTIRIDKNNSFIFDKNGDYIHQLYASDYLGSIKQSKDDIPDEVIEKWKDVLIDLVHKKGYNDDFFASGDIQIDWLKEVRDGEDTWIAYPKLSENFIMEACEDIKFKNANSIFFAPVCRTLFKSDSFARKLHEKKNLGSYFGYDGTILTGRASNSALYFFQSLLSGNSIEKSEEYIPDKCKKDIWSERGQTTVFVPIYNGHEKDFLFPTITNQVDNSVASNAYYSSQYVEAYGNATSITPSKIVFGFFIGTTENLFDAKNVTDVEVYELAKPLDNGNGNITFRCKFTNLEPAKTYYYCAYTYDGKYYNCGDTCSFTTPFVGETCPANITSVLLDSVRYYRNVENPNRMFFHINAKLDDLTDVEEWGVYYEMTNSDGSVGKNEFVFNEVAEENSFLMYYSGPNNWTFVDVNACVAELKDKVGAYVRKRDKTTGELVTLYSALYGYTLRYDKKPSLTIYDPLIKETKVIETDGENKKYETTTSCTIAIEGSFWFDYIDSGISGGEWQLKTNDPWYPIKDYSTTREFIDTYSSNSTTLNHTTWYNLHLRNSKTITSNYINWSGQGTITNVWVSDAPSYARQAEPLHSPNRNETESTNTVTVPADMPTKILSIPTEKRMEIPRKGGVMGTCR